MRDQFSESGRRQAYDRFYDPANYKNKRGSSAPGGGGGGYARAMSVAWPVDRAAGGSWLLSWLLFNALIFASLPLVATGYLFFKEVDLAAAFQMAMSIDFYKQVYHEHPAYIPSALMILSFIYMPFFWADFWRQLIRIVSIFATVFVLTLMLYLFTKAG